MNPSILVVLWLKGIGIVYSLELVHELICNQFVNWHLKLNKYGSFKHILIQISK